MSFLKTLEESWKLSSSAALNYVKALSDMIDFRKVNGISDTIFGCFTVTEVYSRRAKENLQKRKNVCRVHQKSRFGNIDCKGQLGNNKRNGTGNPG